MSPSRAYGREATAQVARVIGLVSGPSFCASPWAIPGRGRATKCAHSAFALEGGSNQLQSVQSDCSITGILRALVLAEQ